MAGEQAVDVAPEQWVAALTRARDELCCTFFDWLTAVDELEDGFSVIAHVWSIPDRRHLLLRTRVPREEPRLATATGVYRGANWHERETYEMFGIEFVGHPNLVRLLLPDEFQGRPLRKDFVLAARVAKPWPGAVDPGESATEGRRTRKPKLPPGVPAPGEWGGEGPRRDDAERSDAVGAPPASRRDARGESGAHDC